MVLPFAVPVRFSEFPGVAEVTASPNEPVTLPLKFPVSENDPVSVDAVPKHGEGDVIVKLLTLTDPLLPLDTSDIPSVNWVALLESISVAFQLPLMLAGFVLFEPQPTRVSAATSNTANANCFINNSSVSDSKGRANLDAKISRVRARDARERVALVIVGTRGGVNCCMSG